MLALAKPSNLLLFRQQIADAVHTYSHEQKLKTTWNYYEFLKTFYYILKYNILFTFWKLFLFAPN